MARFPHLAVPCLAVACAFGFTHTCTAAERIYLRNGFTLDCDHRESLPSGRVRLVMDARSSMEVDAASIASAEPLTATPSANGNDTQASHAGNNPAPAVLTTPDKAALQTMIATAAAARNINLDLLQSVIDAESGGHIRAVSRTGAQGLMQLMPSTARAMGVHDSFAPAENLRGGTAYLDALLTSYHNDLVLALAAYNAGPGAVDHYHGVPPYRETVAYVRRIVHEFNRRTLAQQRLTAQQKVATQQLGAAVLGAALP